MAQLSMQAGGARVCFGQGLCLHTAFVHTPKHVPHPFPYSPSRGVFLQRSTFNNNTLPNVAGTATTGGAIYLNDGNATVTDSTFTKNIGRRGGALYLVTLDSPASYKRYPRRPKPSPDCAMYWN